MSVPTAVAAESRSRSTGVPCPQPASRTRADSETPSRNREDFSPVTVFVPVRGVRLREFVVAAAHGVLVDHAERPGLHYSNCGKDGHGRRSPSS